MHTVIGIVFLLFSIKFVKWKQWDSYYSTVVYVVLLNFIYEFYAYTQFPLWSFTGKDFLFHSEGSMFLLHTLITDVAIVLLFLSHYPNTSSIHSFIYILKWTFVSTFVEWCIRLAGYITYSHHWNVLWSGFFYLVMYIMIRFHHQRTLWAIPASVGMTLFYLIMFGYNLF